MERMQMKLSIPEFSKVETVVVGVVAIFVGYGLYKMYNAASDFGNNIANSDVGKAVGDAVDRLKKLSEPSVDSTSPRAVELDIDRENEMLKKRSNPELAAQAQQEWYESDQYDRSIKKELETVNTDDQLFNGVLTPGGI
jgi:hypothetical protein